MAPIIYFVMRCSIPAPSNCDVQQRDRAPHVLAAAMSQARDIFESVERINILPRRRECDTRIAAPGGDSRASSGRRSALSHMANGYSQSLAAD